MPDPVQELQAGSAAVPAFVTLHLGQYLDMTASDGRITVGYGLSAMPIETTNDTALGAGLKGLCVFSFYGVSVAVLVRADNAPAWHVENICHAANLLLKTEYFKG
jgi:hypothetical protein